MRGIRLAIVTLGLLGLFTTSLPALAAVNSLPEFNPLCWKKEACAEERLNFMGKDAGAASGEDRKAAEAGWIENEGECATQGWGKCLPAGATKTSISFGGKTEFLHIGEFIQVGYKYALAIVGIVAAAVVVVSGLQWTASGGNSEIITSAKTRIAGAMTGLLIAYLSYTILNLVNPSLVNFRLPQVWMVRPQGIVPQFCTDAPAEIKNVNSFAQAADWMDQISPIDSSKTPEYNLSLKDQTPVNLQRFYCGKRFLIKEGGPQACFGNYCGPGQLCIDANNVDLDTSKRKYVCRSGMLGGRVSGTFGVFRIPAVDSNNNIKLMAACKDKGVVEEVADIDFGGYSPKGDPYFFPPTDKIKSICNSAGGTVGFFLGVEANDETGFAGGGWKEGLPFALSTGSDDWMAVGQTAPGSHNCSVNLAKWAIKDCGKNIQWCSCSYLSYPAVAYELANRPGLSDEFKKHLISLEELEQGYVCNINITRSEFPAIPNVQALMSWKEAAGYAVAGGTAGATLGAAIPLPGVGAIAGGVIGAVATPIAAQINDWFARLLDDPTSCRDHQ